VWIVFITLYTGLFFFNCLSQYRNWTFPYIYTMLLILWLAREYYVKNLFFQSGLLPMEKYNFALRAMFALFFYSSFIVGIITVVAWDKYQIKAYPIFQLIGIALLLYSVFIRTRITRDEQITTRTFENFYFSLIVLMISMCLGYGSYFMLLYMIIVGLPLIFLQARYEERIFRQFQDFVQGEQKTTRVIKRGQYEQLWAKYLEKVMPGRKK